MFIDIFHMSMFLCERVDLLFIVSSPELKAQVSYFDRPSVRPSVCL
jgi:hypothetical protein